MTLQEFKKTKDYLICVDSDGCAMNNIDIKHFRCFGPCMVEEWGLGKRSKPILKLWNDINLYSMVRVPNRFKGLAIVLWEVDWNYKVIKGVKELANWANTAPDLSNGGLKEAIEAGGGEVLKKALNWSIKADERINALPLELKKPFEGVAEGLEYAHSVADIAVISTANLQAEEEWARHGLLDHVDVLLTRDVGSKAFCIGELLKKGYNPNKVLMVGDAPRDLGAARANRVHYYPILARHEGDSWKEFRKTAVGKLTKGRYADSYEREKIDAFTQNLT